MKRSEFSKENNKEYKRLSHTRTNNIPYETIVQNLPFVEKITLCGLPEDRRQFLFYLNNAFDTTIVQVNMCDCKFAKEEYIIPNPEFFKRVDCILISSYYEASWLFLDDQNFLIKPLQSMDMPNEPECLSYFTSASRIQIHFNNMRGAMHAKENVSFVNNVIKNMSTSVKHIELCGMSMFIMNKDKRNEFKEEFPLINIEFNDSGVCICPNQDGYNKI